MAEMKTIRFPGSSEVYEIVDAAARSGVASLQTRVNGLIDDTLSEAGNAADAKAAGEAIETVGEVAQAAATAAETSTNTLRQLLPTTSGMGVRVTLDDDTIAAPLAGLMIYGKSTQAAAPSRTSPADIATAGSGGVIAIVVKDGSGNAKSGADIPLNTTAGLLGIAVPATGIWNHRGEDGTCWLCDVVDFNTGTYTRRLGMTTFRDLLGVTYESATGIFKTMSPQPTALFTNYIMTRIYESVDNDYYPPALQDGQICPINAGPHVQWKDSRFDSVEALMDAIGDEPILYKLRNDVSTKLTDRQLAAFRSLMSAEGTTVVYADDPVAPEVNAKAYRGIDEYVATVNRRVDDLESYVRDMSPLATVGPADIVSIEDAAPLSAEGLKVDVEPKQDLHGYENPWPAGGGANKWDEEWETGLIGWTGQDVDGSNAIRSKGFMPVSEGNVYRVVTSNNLQFCYYDSNKNFVSYEPTSKANQSTITIPAGCAYIRFYTYGTTYGGTYKNDIAINYPSTVTAYAPYSNICPITGWNGVTVKDEGKNLLPNDASFISPIGTTPYAGYVFNVPDGTHLYMSVEDNDTSITVPSNISVGFCAKAYETGLLSQDDFVWCINNGNISQRHTNIPQSNNQNNRLLKLLVYPKTQDNIAKIFQRWKITVSVGDEATPFTPYVPPRPASVSFPETVYGGTADLTTGECVADRAMVDLGTLTWELVSSGSFTPYFKANVSSLGIKYEGGFGTTAYHILSSMYKCVARSSVEFVDKTMCADGSSTNLKVTQIQIKDSAYSDATAFKAAMSGVQLVYELANPTTFTLTAAELELFKGVNNISADAGQVTVTYRQDVFLALNKRINELQALVLES